MHSQDHQRLITRLESQDDALSGEDRDAVLALPLVVKTISARADIVQYGDRPTHCCLVLDGWLQRYKGLPDGHRQVLSYHLPGDIPDFQSIYLPVMDHTLATVAESRVAFIPHQAVRDIVGRYPNVAAALWRGTLIEAALFREWIVNVGARVGARRMGHLICELFSRLTSIGVAERNTFTLPLTQADLGDATGLSAVHANRCIHDLRSAGLIETRGRTLHILDWPRLQKFCRFDPAYLHLRNSPTERAMAAITPANERSGSALP